MPRPQFSLKTLLWLMAVVAAFLGGMHLVEMYGQQLDVTAAVGQPIKVKARYVRLFGPKTCIVTVMLLGATRDARLGLSREEWVERSWLCSYAMECEFEPVKEPRQLIFELGEVRKMPAGRFRQTYVKRQVVDMR
jgi:hypothetical protein